MKLLCLGFSYTARAYVRQFGGAYTAITATARQTAKAADLTSHGINAIWLGEDGASDRLAAAVIDADVILISAGPDDRGDPFLAEIDGILSRTADDRGTRRQWLYLSTVGIYGDHDGALVDETTLPRPVSKRSILRLEAENAWRAMAGRHHQSLQVFRLAGIYGPGRNGLINLQRGTARRLIKPGQVFNRIHVDDIALTLHAALQRGSADAVWNVCDNEPAPPQDVVAYGAHLLGIPAPSEQDFSTANLTPMARSFYGENKRVSNRRMREDLGVVLAYPSYREGLAALLAMGEGIGAAGMASASDSPP